MANVSADDYVVCDHCGQRFGMITGTHLRRHGYTGLHPVLEYMERLALVSPLSAALREKIIEQKIEYWKRRKRWTNARILDEIRRRFEDGLSLKSKQVPNALLLAASRRFGSWAVALQMASLDYDAITSRRQWIREKVIAEIRKLEADQVPLNGSWIQRRYGDLYSAALKLFPRSWGKALQAAGFDPFEHKKRRGRWKRKQAEAWVRKRIDKGLSLLARDVPRDLRYFVVDALKTNWTDFVESFGIPYPGTKKRRDWSKETVLDEIHRWAAEGHCTNHSSVTRDFQMLIIQARKYWGSWDAARAAAGVPIDRGPAAEPSLPVVAESLPRSARASELPPVQVSKVEVPVAAERRAAGAARSHGAETEKRRGAVGIHELESPGAHSQSATRRSVRRVASDGSQTATRDPILAFLARGGADE
jgi:hypothetical protein